MPNMGLQLGLGDSGSCIKRKFRWQFKITDVSVDGVNALPPSKGARPDFSFKEMEVKHVNETIYYPARPEWKTVDLVLYDLKRNNHPVFEWLAFVYDPRDDGTWRPSVGSTTQGSLKRKAILEMYNGCGNVLERWAYDNAWPKDIKFGELDMGNSEYVTVDITLRYDRAYLEEV